MQAKAVNKLGLWLIPTLGGLLASALSWGAPVTVNLCAKAGSASMPDGAVIPIWGFAQDSGGGCGAAQLPGPVLEVTAGDVVTVNLRNDLGQNVSILFRGQSLRPDTVGVPRGGTASYTFTAANPGAYLYEAGTNPAIQGPMGLYGALIVRPATAGQAYDDPATAFDQEAVLVLSEIDPNLNANPAAFDLLGYHPTYWLINGAAYPQTAAIAAGTNTRLLLRYLNPSSSHLTMGLLGAHQRIIGKDGYPLAHPYDVASETVTSGQTVDAIAVMPAGGPYPLYNRQMYLTNGPLPTGESVHATGGMLTFVAGSTTPAAPVAVNDAFVVAGSGGTLNVPVPGVLANDSDVNGDPLTAVVDVGPTHASAFVLNADGSFSYTNNGDGVFSDSFTYRASDGQELSNIATVSLAIGSSGDRIGVWRPSTQRFYLDADGSLTWTAVDLATTPFGTPSDRPVAGDWNGDGTDEIGVRNPTTRRFVLDTDGSKSWTPGVDVITAPFGATTDHPVAGDWNGDGIDDIGVWRPSNGRFLLDMDGSRSWTAGVDIVTAPFGLPTDYPVIGDWNGDGSDDVGVWRPSTARFYLDFDGSRTWTPGVDVTTPAFGTATDRPLAGDWNGDGFDDLGVWRSSTGSFYLDTDGSLTWVQGIDAVATSFGLSADLPVIGRW